LNDLKTGEAQADVARTYAVSQATISKLWLECSPHRSTPEQRPCDGGETKHDSQPGRYKEKPSTEVRRCRGAHVNHPIVAQPNLLGRTAGRWESPQRLG
jgi:hypothetical protein